MVALLLVGSLLTPLALTALWARETISSTDGYVAVADTLAADDDVREALVDHLTTATLDQVDAGAPLRLAMESLVREVLTRVVDSDAFATAWSEANRRAHTTALALLTDGDAGALSLSDDGQVTLDLAPVVELARAELLARGITLADSLPQIDASVPLVSSEDLVTARSAYATLDTVADWLPWVAALMLVAAVALARRRAAALAWAAGLVVAATALVSLAVVVGRSWYVESLSGSRLRTEVTVALADTLGESALAALRTGYVLGAGLAVAAVVVWLVARLTGRRRTQPVPPAQPA